MIVFLTTLSNYKMSLPFFAQIRIFQKLLDLFWVGMIEKNKQLSQRHFPSLSQFEGKGGKGTQPLWVKGFRSRFNWLADMGKVEQKTWSGL